MDKQRSNGKIKAGFLKALSRNAKANSKTRKPPAQFWRPGGDEDVPQHAGKGPKNYTRKDDRILEDVCEYLTQDPQIDATNIEVAVQDGVVTLTGVVQNLAMKQAAHDCAQSAHGVNGINNEIDVENVEVKTSEV